MRTKTDRPDRTADAPKSKRAKHPVLGAIGALFLVMILIGALMGGGSSKPTTSGVSAAATPVHVGQFLRHAVKTKIALDHAKAVAHKQLAHDKQYQSQQRMLHGGTPTSQTDCMYKYMDDVNAHLAVNGHVDSHLPALCHQAGLAR